MNGLSRRLAAPLALALLGSMAAPGASTAQQVARIPFAEKALSGAPTPVFTVGREEGQSWEMLSNAEHAAFDAQDNLYVLDRGNQRVLVFDRTGRFVRQIGKKGDGPGELQMPTGLALLPDGNLAVLDAAHRNLSLFARDGRYLRSVSFAEGAGFPMLRIAAHPSGGIVAVFRPSPLGAGGQLRSGSFTLPAPVLSRMALSDGARPARLFEIGSAGTATTNVTGQSGSSQQVSVRMPGPPVFGPPQLWGVLPNGQVVVANTPGYTLRVLDANGQMVRAIQRAQHVRLATEADRERAREVQRERMRTGQGMIVIGSGRGGAPVRSAPSAADIEARLADMQFADTIPALRGLTVAPSGKLWIERTAPQWGDPGPIDIVTPAGEYVGTVRGQKLPAAVSASGRAAYFERDENDVERVVVKQLPANWR